ncbi:hypothetical protein [Brevibacillus laterosporus]
MNLNTVTQMWLPLNNVVTTLFQLIRAYSWGNQIYVNKVTEFVSLDNKK